VIAALGMYDMPWLRDATDRYWTLIRQALGHGPAALTRDSDPWAIWQSPDLLFAQTCGMPYRTRLHGQVRLVGTPDYGLTGCPAGHYNSVIVVRGDDPRDTLAAFAAGTIAYNEPLSQSGWAAPVTHLATQGLSPGARVQTGAHAASVAAVAEGRADWAGIDALTWELLDEAGRTEGLRVLDRTDPTPALPYITAIDRDPAPIAAAVNDAIDTLAAADRTRLHLRGLVSIPAATYLSVPTPPAP
jgi:ABC-type phosphate/phosphonate transport system substrate-binding protein